MSINSSSNLLHQQPSWTDGYSTCNGRRNSTALSYVPLFFWWERIGRGGRGYLTLKYAHVLLFSDTSLLEFHFVLENFHLLFSL